MFLRDGAGSGALIVDGLRRAGVLER